MRYTTFAAVLAALVLSSLPVRAGDVSWDYSFSVNKTNIQSDVGSGVGEINLYVIGGSNTTNNQSIPAVLLTTSSSADPKSPATFTHADYEMYMNITDNSSGQTKTLTFKGEFDSGDPKNPAYLTWKDAYLPHQIVGSPTQSVTFDNGNKYTVTMQVTSPGKPGYPLPGSISTITNVTVTQVPEPSTLLLGGLGMTALGLRTWWQRRRRQRTGLALA